MCQLLRQLRGGPLEVLEEGTEFHLASFCLADGELCLAGTDDPAFAASIALDDQMCKQLSRQHMCYTFSSLLA